MQENTNPRTTGIKKQLNKYKVLKLQRADSLASFYLGMYEVLIGLCLGMNTV